MAQSEGGGEIGVSLVNNLKANFFSFRYLQFIN